MPASTLLGLLLHGVALIVSVECFQMKLPPHPLRHNHLVLSDTALFSSGDNDDGGGGKGKDELKSLRLMLEDSWNAETMGEIPSDASVAAKEAFQTIEIAIENGVSVFLVDLLLPAYDINQGSNLYDEVLAVEYCIALSEYLEGKTSILVRDAKVLEIVSRILDARETAMDDEPLEEAEIDSDDADIEAVEEVADEDVEEDDEEDSPPATDIDSFRQSLMASWDADGDDSASDLEDGTIIDPPTAASVPKAKFKKEETATPSKPRKAKTKRHRLASMFGKQEISQGADMMTQVVHAIRENALPEEDEDNIIILSSQKLEETVAVRSLVDKYGDQKKVILVNCKLDPLPPELRTAETVYSLMPLIAKKKGPEGASSDDQAPPKVVVLRRYPKPWEVYVDVGSGFQLADSIAPNSTNKRGLRIEQITESVKRFLR